MVSSLTLVTLLLGGWGAAVAADSYALYNADSEVLLDASENCLAAFNANVTCPSLTGELFSSPFFEFNRNTTWLDLVCATSCRESLQEHRNNVRTACTGARYYDEFEKTTWQPWYPDDYMIYSHDIACMTRSDGQLCNAYFWENGPPESDCDECMLKIVHRQVNSPFAGDESDRAHFSSVTEACQATGYSVTVATSLLISTPTPTATGCTGTTYAIQPTDDFYSIPKAQSVGTDQLLRSNGLSYVQDKFPTTGTLCIENKCQTHVLAPNDTCASIAAAAGIWQVQLLTWNPNINPFCRPVPDNVGPNVNARCGRYYAIAEGEDCATITLKFNIGLNDFIFLNPDVNANCTNLWLNYSYCVQPVGEISTYPGYLPGPTATRPPFTAGPSTSIPWYDPDPTQDADLVVIPLANLTRTDCWDYIWINSTDPDRLGCWDYAWAAGVEPDQFALWNPSIDQNAEDSLEPTYDYPCTLTPSVSYCIGLASPTPAPAPTASAPVPRASGEISDCVWWTYTVEHLSCEDLLSNLGLTIAVFYQMNPSVKEDCTGLAVGTYYCGSTLTVGILADDEDDENPSSTPTSPPPTPTTTPGGVVTPTPTQEGMVSNCVEFYLVVTDDGCWSIANDHSISQADLYAWNPTVGNDCAGLWPDYYICVGVEGTTTATTPTATATATATPTSTEPGPPGPTQAGIPDNCNKWIMQQDGVFCYDMAASAGIELQELYKLNPALNGDCSGLWSGYAYCVGTA
ncbi:hypothetical protein CNMCM7691_006047 [Aspergillus felis]|uniref:LysM domain-containing protein n=1 Tax=Aspergillus felis TaxID=1287682 RepID=A0A8H6VF70_9EURO|nr:hypothetical protein CNMCM7691_006047 [Aspergillus felis]